MGKNIFNEILFYFFITSSGTEPNSYKLEKFSFTFPYFLKPKIKVITSPITPPNRPA